MHCGVIPHKQSIIALFVTSLCLLIPFIIYMLPMFLKEKLAKNLEGIKEMRKIPDAMVVVDPKAEHNAVAEAKILNIPVFALLGSNCNPQSVTFPIPCNDDSSKTIKLILGLLADAVVEGKGGDVAYAYQHVEGDEAKMSEILKGVERPKN